MQANNQSSSKKTKFILFSRRGVLMTRGLPLNMKGTLPKHEKYFTSFIGSHSHRKRYENFAIKINPTHQMQILAKFIDMKMSNVVCVILVLLFEKILFDFANSRQANACESLGRID